MSFTDANYINFYSMPLHEPEDFYPMVQNSVPMSYSNSASSHNSQFSSYNSNYGANGIAGYTPSQLQYMAHGSTNTSSNYSRHRSSSNGSGYGYEQQIRSIPTSPSIEQAISGAGSQYQPYSVNTNFERQGHNHVQTTNGRHTSDQRPESKEKVFCQHPQCRDEDGKPCRSYSRRADVSRHYRSAHEPSFTDCPFHKCSRKGSNGFTRKDHLAEHLRGYHQQNIPKRGSISADDSSSSQGTVVTISQSRPRHARR